METCDIATSVVGASRKPTRPSASKVRLKKKQQNSTYTIEKPNPITSKLRGSIMEPKCFPNRLEMGQAGARTATKNRKRA